MINMIISDDMILFTSMKSGETNTKTGQQFPHLQNIIAGRLDRIGRSQEEAGAIFGFSQAQMSGYIKYPERLKAKGVDFSKRFFLSVGFNEAEARELVRELWYDEFINIYGDVQDIRKYSPKSKLMGN
jgi:predicted transcriptional regulator